jgi:uncharacterized protein YeaO (DUF488 family)
MAASITASPNPVGFWSPTDKRTATISWDTGGAGHGRDELAAQTQKLSELRGRPEHGTVTLVYAAQDTEHNDAVVLAELVREAPSR